MHPDVQTHGLDVPKEMARTKKNDTLRNLSREAPQFGKRRQVTYATSIAARVPE